MATNRKFAESSPLRVAVASTIESGDPVIVGRMAGVALTDYSADDGKATVRFHGVFLLSVKGVNSAGNVAVALGDELYAVSGDSPLVSKKATGVFIGYALEAVASGATTTIQVRLVDSISRGTGVSGTGVAVSAEMTGTGSAQNFAHGLGVVPTHVVVVPSEIASGVNYDAAEGSHTSTNAIVTVTTGVKFKVMAFAG